MLTCIDDDTAVDINASSNIVALINHLITKAINVETYHEKDIKHVPLESKPTWLNDRKNMQKQCMMIQLNQSICLSSWNKNNLVLSTSLSVMMDDSKVINISFYSMLKANDAQENSYLRRRY